MCGVCVVVVVACLAFALSCKAHSTQTLPGGRASGCVAAPRVARMRGGREWGSGECHHLVAWEVVRDMECSRRRKQRRQAPLFAA